jgi:uncharacterized protein (TIGR00266 family)
MDIKIADKGAFSWALVQLEPSEMFVSEAGAMFRASSNIDISVTTRSKGKGGLMSGIRRMLASESFFLSTYSTIDSDPGEVGLAPVHQGELKLVQCTSGTDWICAGGSYLGSSDSLQLDTQFQGLRGAFSGESISFISVSGNGPLLVGAFGSINEINVEGSLVVDTGHVVAFESSLEYTISKAGGSFLQSFLTGEGLTMNFKGHGRILVQSHNPDEFGRLLGPKLPPRKR